MRVAVTLFAEADALDPIEAAQMVGLLIRRVLPFGVTHSVELRAGVRPVVLHAAMETGMAAGNGYLWTEPTSKAFRESPYLLNPLSGTAQPGGES